MKCKRCGTELRNDDEFCYQCGQRTSLFQRMFSNKTFVGSFIAILFVAVAAVLFFLIWTGRLEFPDFSSRPESVSEGDGGKTDGPVEPDKAGAATPAPEQGKTAAPVPTATPEVFVPADVTKTMKKELKPLFRRVRPFLSFSADYYERGTNKFRWDNEFATILALYNLHYVDEDIRYGDSYTDIKKKVKREMKELFGRHAKYKLNGRGTYPGYVYRRVNNTVVYNARRPVGKTYSLSVDKVIEYEENKYRAVVSACMAAQNDAAQKGHVQKYTLLLERDEDSKYGCVVAKMKNYKKKDSEVEEI